MSYLYKTPKLLKWYYPDLIWDYPLEDKSIYLTFDDGPTKEHTKWILELLGKYDAQATFFCVGNNVQSCKEEFNEIIVRGPFCRESHIQSFEWAQPQPTLLHSRCQEM